MKRCNRCGDIMDESNSNAGCDVVCIPCAALRPGCHGKEATKEMFISYGTGETDTLHVCAECCERIHKSATKHGYLISWKHIGGGAKKVHNTFDKSLFTGGTRT